MNYFPFFYYPILSGFFYLIWCYYINYDPWTISDLFEWNNYVERIWIFPFYILSELCYLGLTSYETFFEKKEFTEEEKKESLQNLAVVIPCHDAMEEIQKNKSIFQEKFTHVFIADNDKNDFPNKEFLEFCQQSGFFYLHHSLPNKTNAILKTVYHIKKHFPCIDKILLLDDDTVIRNDFFIRNDLLADPTVAGYTCTIGINKSREFNFLEHWIDFEYRTISYRNRSRNFHSLKFLHGIMCVYKIDALIRIYEWNVCNEGGLPFGEDAFSGLQARKVGYKLKQDKLNLVYTYCPKQLFNFNTNQRTQGYGACSLFKQRVLRWYLSWPRRVFDELGLLFSYDTGSYLGNVLYRFDFIWYAWILSVACWWIAILVEMSFSMKHFKNFLLLHGFFYIINIFTCYLRSIVMSKLEKHNIHYIAPLTFPLFLLILLFFYSSSFILSIFYYIPFRRIDYKKCYQHVGTKL